MSDAVELVVLLAAKDAVSGVLEGVGKKLAHLGPAGDLAKLAIGGVVAGLGVAALAGVEFAKAAADEEQGIFRLAQAVTNAGGNWDVLQGSIEGTIASMERTTAFSDGEMRDALSLLTAQTGDVEESMRRLPIAADFARGANIDLATASKLLGKVTDETTNVLGRYGIHIQKGADATEVLGEVQKRFGGQSAAFASTAAGKWKIFSNQLDNLKEDIGAGLLPIMTGLGETAVNVVDAIREALARPEIVTAIATISDIVKTAIGIFSEMFGVITGSAPDAGAKLAEIAGPKVAGGIMQVLALIRDEFKALFSIVGGIIKGFTTGDWSALQGAVSDGAKSIGGRLEGLAGLIAGAVGNLLGELIAAAPKIRDQMFAWAKEFIGWVLPAARDLIDNALKGLGTFLNWIGDHSEDIGKMLVEWGLEFGKFIFTTAIPAIAENLPGIVLNIGKWVLTDAIPAVLRIMAGLGKGIVEGIWSGIQSLAGWFGDRIHAFILEHIPDAVRKLLGIESPSTVMAELGLQISKGLAQGITDGSSAVGAAVHQVIYNAQEVATMAAAALAAVGSSYGAGGQSHGGVVTKTNAAAGIFASDADWRAYLAANPAFAAKQAALDAYARSRQDINDLRNPELRREAGIPDAFGIGLRAQTRPIELTVNLDGREIARNTSQHVMDDYVGAGGRISR